MKFGMPTLIEFKDVIDNFDLCSKLGLDFVELNMNIPYCNPEFLCHKEILEYKRRYNIDCTIHLPEELDLSSFHHVIRKGHIERCKEAIDWANRSEINLLNMHLNQGIYFTLPDRRVWIYEENSDIFIENLQSSYSELYRFASDRGVTLCIENTGNFQIPFVKDALQRLNIMEGFSLTWDVGHDAKAGFVEEPVFYEFESKIKHMHLHDYNGKSDHQIVYTGDVPINTRLELAKKKGISVVIEVKTASALQKSVRNLGEVWK